MLATATATDPLSLTATGTKTETPSGTGTRTIRRTLMTNRVAWGGVSPGFQDTQGPEIGGTPDFQTPDGPATVSVIFTMQRDATITGCRIYKSPTQAASINVGMWNSGGTLVGSKTVTWVADAGGWTEILFTTPVSVTNGSEYTIGYLVPDFDYAHAPWVWNAQDTVVYPFWIRQMTESSGVRARGSAYVLGASLTFPTQHSPTDFYIDPIAEWTDDLPAYTGGTAFFDQFVTAGSTAAFPVGVFFGDPENLAAYAGIGINTLIAGDASESYIAAVKATGLDWYPTLHGGDITPVIAVQEDTVLAGHVRGYFLTDEPDLITPYNSPTVLQGWRNLARARDSTRPIMLNLSKVTVQNQGFIPQPPTGNAVSWNQDWRSYAALADILSCDFYNLTAENDPSDKYGIWTYACSVRRMAELNDGRNPAWAYVESTSQTPGQPLAEQARRAAWAGLIAGARGLVFFDHRFADSDVTQDFAAMLHDPAMNSMVGGLSALLQTLGPALMAPDADLITGYTSSGTMTEAKGGEAIGAAVPIHYTTRVADGETYIFVQAIRPGTTTATITAPSLASATLNIVGGGTVSVDGSGNFTATFSSDYDVQLFSTATLPTFAAPVNTVAPALTTDGSPSTGETISCSLGTWTGTPAPAFTYEWFRDGFSLGVYVSTYTLVSGDVGHLINCQVSATNSVGFAGAFSDTITPTAGGGGGGGSSLTLTTTPVDGGPGYLSTFSTPISTDPTFFPIGVWFANFVDQSEIDIDVSVGINLYVVLDTGADTTLIAPNNLKILAQEEDWHGSPMPIPSWRTGWFLRDEIDMIDSSPSGAAAARATLNSVNASLPADGKIRAQNFGKGVLLWNTESDAQHFINDFQQAQSCDLYWFTDPYMKGGDVQAPSWLPESGAFMSDQVVMRGANYGYLIDYLRHLDSLGDGVRKPIWAFVETGWPWYDSEAGSAQRGITTAEMRSAVWHSIIAGALGILYFNHSFGGPEVTYNVYRDPFYSSMRTALTAVNAQIQSLKDVIFAPTVTDAAFTHSTNVRTMGKVHGGYLTVFAASITNGGTGSHTGTFSVTGLGDQTATVLGESRTVTVTAGAWSDTFANNNAVHIYQIPMPPGSYSDAVLADHPVGYWRLDTLNDSSGNGLTLTDSSSGSAAASLITSDPGAGKAQNFGGSDTFTHADATVLNPTGAISIEAWLKLSMSGPFTAVSHGRHGLEATDGGFLHFRVRTILDTGEVWVDSPTTITVGTIYHVVMTQNGTDLKLYINGVFDSSFTWAGHPIAQASPLMIGNRSGDFGWEGDIDEVAIYGTALTAAQVLAHYNAGI